MFFPCGNKNSSIIHVCNVRKETCILPARNYRFHTSGRERRFSVIRGDDAASGRITKRKQGSLTLEAACVLPMFLFAMLAVLQFGKVMWVSSAMLAGMQNTAKDMAAYAYIRELDISAGDGVAADLLAGGISAVYARSQIIKNSGFSEDLGRFSLLQSDFLHNNIIDLAVAYYPDDTAMLIPAPKLKAVLRARVRAWTGREGSGETAGEEGKESQEESTVYVTTTGTVYHKDLNCTHIRLSIQTVTRESVDSKRNSSGGKYHPCERCGSGIGTSVYITDYGDRYHGSLDCSGLKRNILEVPQTEVKGWKPCSKCG